MSGALSEPADPDVVARLEAGLASARGALRQRAPVAALAAYRDALLDAVSPEHGPVRLSAAHLVMCEQAADLALLLGDWPAAESLLLAVERAARDAGNLEGADYALLKRAHAQTLRGDLEAALAALEALEPSTGPLLELDFDRASLARWEGATAWATLEESARALLLSRLYLLLGTLLVELGQYQAALGSLARGLEIARATKVGSSARAAETAMRLCRAHAFLELGRLADAGVALEALEEAVDGREAPAMHVAAISLSGRLAHLRGDLGVALQRFEEVCAFCATAGFPRAELTARLNHAAIQIAMNQTRAAEAQLDAAARVVAVLGDERLAQRIGWLREAAAARRRGGDRGLVLAPSVRAMQSGRREGRLGSRAPKRLAPVRQPDDAPPEVGDFWSRFEHRAEEIAALLRSGAVGRAAGLLRGAKTVFGSTDSPFLLARLRYLDAMLAESDDDLAKAREHYRTCEQAFAGFGATTELWRTQHALARVSLAAAEPDGSATRADETLERLAASLPASTRAIYLLDKSDAEEGALTAEIAAIVPELAAADAAPFWRRFRERRTALAPLLRLLAKLDARRQGEPAGVLSARLSALPAGSVTVAFVVLPELVLVLAASRRGVAHRVAPLTRLGLRDSVAQWHLCARSPGPLDEVGTRALARLAETLGLEPLIRHVGRRCDRLRVVADDVLHGVPFAALPFDGRALVERYAVCMVRSFFPARARADAGAVRGQLTHGLAVGVSRAGGGFSALPEICKEVAHFAAWLRRMRVEPTVLLDGHVSKVDVMARLTHAELAHIACHGTFDLEQLDASGLVLEPGASPPRLLTLRDISGLNLSATRHVTLSACWAADNYVLPGRRVLSLPDSFLRAGVGTVLACLWRVSDAAAHLFVQRFYALAEHRPRGEALRLAQLACLRGELGSTAPVDVTSPYVWAAFAMYGEAGMEPLVPWWRAPLRRAFLWMVRALRRIIPWRARGRR